MTDKIKVCGTCDYSTKNAHGNGWLCLYSFANNKQVEYSDSCNLYAPKNLCNHCPYRYRVADQEPCASCTRAKDGYKSVEDR